MRKFLYLFFLLSFISCSHNNSNKIVVLNGKTMGTTYQIKYLQSDSLQNTSQQIIQNKIDSILIEVNKAMSTYIPNSEISLFNKSASTKKIDVSKDFALVVRQALQIGEITNGALDITIAPLVNLWGFGPEEKVENIPTQNEIELQLMNVNFRDIEVEFNPNIIRKKNPYIYLDLSAIAKGFGVDKVSTFLDEINIHNYLVEIGGELKSKGKKQNNEYWVVGILSPKEGIANSIVLNNQAIATSGDYYNYFEYEGKRYSHTIDPKTGKPVTHNLSSVSVVSSSCMVADAFATAISVLGPEKGFELANNLNIAVQMIIRTENGFKEKMNDKFKELVRVIK